MTGTPRKHLFIATGAALIVHALLFLVSPSEGQTTQAAVSPKTNYRFPSPVTATTNRLHSIRVIRSPVVFSLPTEMGFSRELEDHDVFTSKSFAQPTRSERQLDIMPAFRRSDERIRPRHLMVQAESAAPGLPDIETHRKENDPAIRRVGMDRALRNRLMGPIELSAALNQRDEKPWEVHATITVSAEGVVEHVYLDRPLDSPKLNRQVEMLLRGLRFTPGVPLEAGVDVYSSDSTNAGGD